MGNLYAHDDDLRKLGARKYSRDRWRLGAQGGLRSGDPGDVVVSTLVQIFVDLKTCLDDATRVQMTRTVKTFRCDF